MMVLKFGGTSVSSKENLEQIKLILSQKKENYIVVVSAFSGITNKLEQIIEQALVDESFTLIEEFKNIHFKLIHELIPIKDQTELLIAVQEKCNELEAICKGIYILKELTDKTKAKVLGIGEQLSSLIVHSYLNTHQIPINFLDSRGLICAGNDYLDGDVDFEVSTNNILKKIKKENYITGGFIASNENNETVLLGRGGSDFTASIYASAIRASSIEIWSDVDGIHSANPQKVKNTLSLKKLSYEEAFEMAYFGAKVIYPQAILPLIKKKIPLYLKNTFRPEQEGTFISHSHKKSTHKIQGLSSLNDIAVLTVSGIGLSGKKGSARKVFQTLEEHNVNVILITQSCSEQSIGIGINESDADISKKVLDHTFRNEIKSGTIRPMDVTKNLCIIALIGDNMKNKIGLSGKVFSVIGENGINITAIAQGASERNLSIVIDQKDEVKALNVIHEKFFSNIVKNVHLFIAGTGNVGEEFLKIIYSQKEKLIKEYNINLKVIGVANSTKMLLNGGDEIGEKDSLNVKKTGEAYGSLPEYLSKISELNLPNSIFIDNTASQVVSDGYPYLLENSISISTCNKIACSSDYKTYSQLINAAKEFNCHFKYETTVGAALPVIKTIHDLIISGDAVNKIEAVISGSLNFIFNQYNGENKFADIVLRAKEEGYTEPNPLIDLSGLDVMRKILILSRESGLKGSLSEIKFNSFIPDECTNSESVDALFENLAKHEDFFKALYAKANKKGFKLKVVATLENKILSVGLKEIPSDSPFFNLEGKDNVVALYTDRYVSEPLVIKGAGAGASVTASGVFADVMSIVNK
ncbi:MAG: bifunctional aspartate kinase/homoserine dehydrogenase I [Flavobacteriales bacterium]|nr:bifunctional aspartate kinase/homoserine dehydrogenase I [Flavobacteriales bacterium]